MAQVSGTVSQTSFPTRKVIDHAYRRCRLPIQAVSAEMIEIALDQLYLMLSEWATRGLQLWCIEKGLLSLYNGQAQVKMPLGTVELLNINLRNLQPLTPDVTNVGNNFYSLQFYSPTLVTTLGILWGANAVPIVIERSMDGVVWVQVLSASPTEKNGEQTWLDIDGNIPANYIRVRAPTGTLTITTVYVGNLPNEIVMARLTRDDYFNLPNKTFQGRPLQFWYDRLRDAPVLYLWPVPFGVVADQQYQMLTYLRKRYIMDVGTPLEMLDIPQRWFDTAVSGLAVRLAQITPQVDANLIPILDELSERNYRRAIAEENDGASIYWTPNLRPYSM